MGWCIYVSPTLSIRPALPFPFCPHVLWTLTFDPPFLLWTTSPNSRPRQKAKTTMGFWFLPFLRDYSPSCLLSSSQIKLFFFFSMQFFQLYRCLWWESKSGTSYSIMARSKSCYTCFNSLWGPLRILPIGFGVSKLQVRTCGFSSDWIKKMYYPVCQPSPPWSYSFPPYSYWAL